MTWRELAAWSAHEKALTNGKGRIDAVIAACNAYKLFNGEQPTALTDEEWKEIQSKAHSYHRSIWKHDIHKALSRRTAEPQPAEPSPAPSGDVIEQIKAILAREFPALPILHGKLSKEIYSVASADLLANPPQEWLDKRDAEWEAAFINSMDSRCDTTAYLRDIRARLTPNPVERVTVTANAEVLIDGKSIGTFVTITDALKYASIRRAELAKEAEDAK